MLRGPTSSGSCEIPRAISGSCLLSKTRGGSASASPWLGSSGGGGASGAAAFGLVKKEDASVQEYVTRKALDGLYFMIGEEEKKIRRDPVGTGSAVLAKVFGLR